MKRLLPLLFAVALAFSCNKVEENPVVPQENKIEFAEGLVPAPVFDSTGGCETVEFTSSVSWTASVSYTGTDSWCQIVPPSGKAGKASFILNVNPSNEYDERTAIITIKAGNVEKTFNISQKQKDAIVISDYYNSISSRGGEIKIKVTHNIDYTIDIDSDWVNQVVSKSVVEDELTFSVDKHEAKENRIAKIVFTNSEKGHSETVTIEQMGLESLLILNDKYSVGNDGGEFYIESNIDMDFEVYIPPTNSWIEAELIKSSDDSRRSLHITVDKNEWLNSREGIVIATASAVQTDTIFIEQKGGIRCTIKQKEYLLPYEATDIQVDWTSNASLTLHVKIEDWDFVRPDSGVVGNDFASWKLHVSENRSSNNRKAYLYVIDSFREVIDSISVTQLASSAIITDKKEYRISEKNQELIIKYRTEYECEIKSDGSADWVAIDESSSKAMSDKALRLKIAENNTSRDRQANIIFSGKNTSFKDTIRIFQVSNSKIQIETNHYELSEMPQEFDIKYNSNVDLMLDIPEGEEYDWINLTESLDGTYRIKLASNTIEDDRECVVTLKDYGNTLSENIVVSQKGCDYFLYSPDHDENGFKVVNYNGRIYEFNINSNGDYKFEILTEDSSYIHYLGRNKISDTEFIETLRLDPNNTTEERKIILQFSLGSIVRRYVIYQAEKRELILSQHEFSIDAKGGTLSLEIKAGGAWAKYWAPFYHHNVSFSASSWISIEGNPEPGSMQDIAVITIQPNHTGKDREGTVKFWTFDGSPDEEYTVVISQSAD